MDIYEPAEDSFLLQKFVRQFAVGRVLDLGTGSGIQALTAASSLNVREVMAVDINTSAVKQLQEKINKEKIKKIKTHQGDLFENVDGSFNLIIFNPPYLPQDQGIEDTALYGGKKGWELSERFFKEVSSHLFPDGKILFLFSSLTNKQKIEEVLAHNLLQFQEVGKEKISFEELYVYLITKSSLLRDLESKSIENISYYAKGKRGLVFTGIFDRSKLIKTHLPSKKELIKVAIKTKRPESKAENRIENEAYWLKVLNPLGIGPQLFFSAEDYLVTEFLDGELIHDWIASNGKKEILKVLLQLLEQCRILDELNVNKEELHHPQKHIIVDDLNRPVMIDFERCSKVERPQNVTQFIEFLARVDKELVKKQIKLPRELLKKAAQEYKQDFSYPKFEIIAKIITEKKVSNS